MRRNEKFTTVITIIYTAAARTKDSLIRKIRAIVSVADYVKEKKKKKFLGIARGAQLLRRRGARGGIPFFSHLQRSIVESAQYYGQPHYNAGLRKWRYEVRNSDPRAYIYLA